jgi:hypothetical protein
MYDSEKGDNKMSPEELVETLRNWEDMFYSESETQLIMKEAADLIESLQFNLNEVKATMWRSDCGSTK